MEGTKMTHHITYGAVGFDVTEEAGTITAATVVGIPNPGATAAHLIGKSFKAWWGRLQARPKFIMGAARHRMDVAISYQKHKEEINAEARERRQHNEAYRTAGNQRSHTYYQTHKDEINRKRKEKRGGEKAAQAVKVGNGT